MPAFIDRTGQRIGRVTIIDFSHHRSGHSIWNSVCDCGYNFKSWSANFKRGDKFECKKCVFERKRGVDLTGRKYGRWTVIERTLDRLNKTQWHVKCDCGNEGYVSTYSLGRKGRSESCGCLGRKNQSKHVNTTLYPPSHKLCGNPFYQTRISLIHKCYTSRHPSYKNFGQKGITFCDLWRNGAKDMYEWAISNGWEKGDVICLKDGCKEFNPENCIVLKEIQFRSEIGLKNGLQITYDGQTHSVSKWAEILQCNADQIRNKLKIYPSVESVLESTFRKQRFFRNPKLIDKMIDLYQQGFSQSEIAKMMKTHTSNIAYYLNIRGIQIRKDDANRPKRKDVKDCDILKLRQKGWSMNGIASKLKCSWPTVKNRIDKSKGIKRKR